MINFFLLPGNLICNAVGLKEESANKQVLRSFFNMMIWSAIGLAVMLTVLPS